MSFGALDALPLMSSDFASACFTASVPRDSLMLTIVRVVATTHGGDGNDNDDIDVARCRTVAVLIDSQHTMSSFRRAVIDAVFVHRRVDESPNAIDALQLYARLTGAPTHIRFSSDTTTATVLSETMLDSGQLRGAVHSGSALRAYRKHVDVHSTVCVDTVEAVYKRYCRAAPPRGAQQRELAHKYVAGLVRLGAGRPTSSVPTDCMCEHCETCNCFLSRAIWRSNNRWLIVYAVLPPVARHHSTTAQHHHNQAVPWLTKLMDSELCSSSSEDAPSNPLDAIAPHRWNRTYEVCHRYLLHQQRLSSSSSPPPPPWIDTIDVAAADDDRSSSWSSVTTSTESFTDEATFVQLCALWAIREKSYIDTLQAVARYVGIYYTGSLLHVVSKSQRAAFCRILPQQAVELSRKHGDAQIYQWLRSGTVGIDGLRTAITQCTQRAHTKLNCERNGYIIAILCAVLLCCNAHREKHDHPTTVNTWHVYTQFDPLL